MAMQTGRILLDLLEREAVALRAGEFTNLTTLLSEKEAVCADPQMLARIDPALMDRIGQLARRNEVLLAAARAGMRSAMERLGAVARASEGLRTYDRAGQSTLLGQGESRPIRRA